MCTYVCLSLCTGACQGQWDLDPHKVGAIGCCEPPPQPQQKGLQVVDPLS